MLWVARAGRARDWFNAGWLRFTGRSLVQEAGLGWAGCVHPADLEHCLGTVFAAFDAGKPFRAEYRLRRHDGAWRWIADHGAPCFEADGRLSGFIGAGIDVQDLHDHAAALDAMERDRVVLLREVHHRVKNNFQLVMSMIGLRSSQLEAASVEGMVLRELQARIGIMAAIQDELVSQPRADRIDFAGQLRRLIGEIGALHEGVAVRVMAEIEPMDVPVDRALTLGLIATELLSNVFKHALPARRGQGQLWVTLRGAGGVVDLSVRDDGPGIPPPEARPRSIGLQIVHALVAQAQGEVEVDTAPGSTVRVRINTQV